MIRINNKIIKQEQFGDGTLKCPVYEIANNSPVNITWCYDNDSELFTLWCLVEDLRQQVKDVEINLTMPYIPHARQDRKVSGKLFTLKYFADMINQMNFENVYVLDPHSDVSTALIDRIKLNKYDIYSGDLYNKKNLWREGVEQFEKFYDPFKDEFTTRYIGTFQLMYPDNGAAKKYSAIYTNHKSPVVIGYKHRNEEGRIDSYELNGLAPTTRTVIIRDDICSYGGTFVAAAKELKKAGVTTIILAVSHCENNILKGEVFDYIDEVWTTDSICTAEHPKLHITKLFRGE